MIGRRIKKKNGMFQQVMHELDKIRNHPEACLQARSAVKRLKA